FGNYRRRATSAARLTAIYQRRSSKHQTLLTLWAETHNLPSPTRIAPLPRAGPNRFTTRLVFKSMTMSRSLSPRTQTAPSPAAMSPPKPCTPVSIVATTLFVSGSIRETVPSAWFRTHTAPSPDLRGDRGRMPPRRWFHKTLHADAGGERTRFTPGGTSP